jgi:lysophospholipase L1-like esterase
VQPRHRRQPPALRRNPRLPGHVRPRGIERYRYDLLPIEGLTHAVFALGTNDLGHPGTGGAPEEELITVDQYAAAARTIADALHKQA